MLYATTGSLLTIRQAVALIPLQAALLSIALDAHVLAADTVHPGAVPATRSDAPLVRQVSASRDSNTAGGIAIVIIIAIVLWVWSLPDYAAERRAVERKKAEQERHAALERARQWATKFVRERFARSALTIEPHYTSADLEEDLNRANDGATTPGEVRERAKVLVAQIERFRAYETVRAAYRAEVEVLGAHFPYEAIANDVEALLDGNRRLTDLRSAELELLGRIKRLARYYREHPPIPDKVAPSLDDAAAAIECEVRKEAQPGDTEEDIQREIAERRRRLYASHEHSSESE